MRNPTGTEKEVCDDIAKRQEYGMNKYGTSVADNPLSLKQWLQHAYEETLDKAIYLKRAIGEIDELVSVNNDGDEWINAELDSPLTDENVFVNVKFEHQTYYQVTEGYYDIGNKRWCLGSANNFHISHWKQVIQPKQ